MYPYNLSVSYWWSWIKTSFTWRFELHNQVYNPCRTVSKESGEVRRTMLMKRTSRTQRLDKILMVRVLLVLFFPMKSVKKGISQPSLPHHANWLSDWLIKNFSLQEFSSDIFSGGCCSGLSLRARSRDFLWLLWAWPQTIFVGNRRKNKTKENSCSLQLPMHWWKLHSDDVIAP